MRDLSLEEWEEARKRAAFRVSVLTEDLMNAEAHLDRTEKLLRKRRGEPEPEPTLTPLEEASAVVDALLSHIDRSFPCDPRELLGDDLWRRAMIAAGREEGLEPP